jgi:hypothetical protein
MRFVNAVKRGASFATIFQAAYYADRLGDPTDEPAPHTGAQAAPCPARHELRGVRHSP